METGFNSSLLSQAKGSPFPPPAFTNNRPLESKNRYFSTNPGLTMSWEGGVTIVGFTHSTLNRMTPGTAPEKYLLTHPPQQQPANLFLSKATNQSPRSWQS